MKIKAVRISGFKSFRTETGMHIAPGLTCVVGPNGSGKSNIIDALSWVLGEQGPSSLRGSKMDDVIFAGTSAQGPLGRAYVELILDNQDKVLSSERSEISVSRTLYRSGQSEYRISGQECRLLDVQELLSDAGLGREMHGIVGQGQLDSVLRASPTERRALLEEASGVLKFRRRKERSFRKLESMASNLGRLKDIIAEVERSKKSLGRQAKTAEQAKGIQQAIAALKTEKLSREGSFHKAALASAREAVAASRAELGILEQRSSGVAETLHALANQQKSEELIALRTRKVQLEGLERRTQVLLQLASGQAMPSLDSAEDQRSSSNELKQLVASLEAQTAEISRGVENCESQLADAITARKSATSSLEAQRASREQAKAEIESRQNDRNALERRFESLMAELAAIVNSLAVAANQKQVFIGEIADLKAKFEENFPTSTSDGDLRAAYEAARDTALEITSALEKSRTDLATLEIQLGTKQSRQATLSEHLSRSADEGAETLAAKLAGKSADLLKVDKGFELAIATALGVFASGKAVESTTQGIDVLALIAENKFARTNLFVASGKTSRGKGTAPGSLVAASSVVTAPESLLAHLESYWIADSLDAAREHLNDSTAKGKTIVTRQGDLLSEYFLAGGVQSESSAIEIASELESLGDEIGALENQISVAMQRKLKLEQQVTQANRTTQEALESLRNHDEALAKSAEEAGAIRARISLLEERVVDLEISAEQLAERKDSLESSKASLEAELAAEPEVQEEADTGNLSALETQLEQAREQEVHLRVELGALNERKIAIEKELASTNQRISRIELENKQRQAALEKALKRTQAAEVITSMGTKVLALVAAAGARLLSEIVAMDAERVADQERQSRLLEEKAQAEAQKAELSEKIQSLEMKIYEENLQLSSLDEKSRSELGLPLEALVTRKSEHQDLDDDALQSRIASQESLLSRIGTFNPLAVEEHAALEERYNYLTEQLEDMTKARAEMREIIRDIDSTIDSTFSQAFEDTKKEFEEIFPVLFPGGTGSLSLTEPEGDEEPGIEVSIRPAGKRIERMSLLSGGERSLAAMALLVAIFKARPSPFYVLDEVEAALDDVNLERLLKVLKSLGETSQLIIVTHQKKTMEIADALYGVSMGADGVTKVMSQTLEKAS